MADVDSLQKYVDLLNSGQTIPQSDYEEALNVFESYECWIPFFKLVNQKISNPENKRLNDYLRKAKVQYANLEDYPETAKTCLSAIEDLGLSYHQFRTELLTLLLDKDDWWCEAIILKNCYNSFVDEKDRILCLERLCLIYEKKVFNELELNKTYNLLRSLDPTNIKALRYFKIVHTQNHDWDDVVIVLKSLINASSHQQDIYRYAQELAAVYLYQLDNPKEVVRVLEKHCANSPLDSSTIHYDAYQRLGDWGGCIRVLEKCALSVEEKNHKAILSFRIGQLQEKLKKTTEAKENYKKAFGLWPNFLEPIESLLGLLIYSKEWLEIAFWLEKLSSVVQEANQKKRIEELVQRLKECLQNAQPSKT